MIALVHRDPTLIFRYESECGGDPEGRGARYLEIEIDDKAPQVESRLHALCRDLLSNPVIEDYEVQGMGAAE